MVKLQFFRKLVGRNKNVKVKAQKLLGRRYDHSGHLENFWHQSQPIILHVNKIENSNPQIFGSKIFHFLWEFWSHQNHLQQSSGFATPLDTSKQSFPIVRTHPDKNSSPKYFLKKSIFWKIWIFHMGQILTLEEFWRRTHT